MSDATYILVHGAWGGAWTWRDLGAEFDRHATKWLSLDLPSSQLGAGPATGLAEDADAVAAVASTKGPVVLVAHSYGGAVAAEVAPRIANLRRIVYVAALVPLRGQSPTATSREVRVRTLLDEAILVDGAFLRLDPEVAPSALYNECSPDVSRWATSKLSTQTIASFRSERTSEDVDVASRYVRCSRDHAVDPSLQDVMATRCSEVLTLESDHSPFLSQPAVLYEAITS